MRVLGTTLVVAFFLGCSPGDPPSVAVQLKEDQIRDQDSVLNKIILDVLSNSFLDDIRHDYSQKGDKRFALVNSDVWPKGFKPSIQGYEFSSFFNLGDRKPDGKAPPLLGIRLDRFDLTAETVDPFNGNVEVCVLNIGGIKGKENGPIGGTSIFYHAKRTREGWSVEMLMLRSP